MKNAVSILFTLIIVSVFVIVGIYEGLLGLLEYLFVFTTFRYLNWLGLEIYDTH